MAEFKPGDLVFLGPRKPLDRAIVWKVVSVYQATPEKRYAVLRSGMTERTVTAPVERLTPFTPRLSEPADV